MAARASLIVAAALVLAIKAQSNETLPPVHNRNHTFGTIDTVRSYGFPVEEHNVTTADGYVITMYRIPNATGTPVLLMHGLLSSSTDFCAPPPDRGLPYLLRAAGYDVWMGNARGNTLSRKAGVYDPDKDAAYWDFSWHEIGVYDVPAFIHYVLDSTGRQDLHFIAHSQGTTAFFVLGSEVPGSMRHIRTAHLMAPVSYMKDTRAELVRAASVAVAKNWMVIRSLNNRQILELLPHTGALNAVTDALCKEQDPTQSVCYQFMFTTAGPSWKRQDRAKLPDYLANLPAGSSLKQFAHYGQLAGWPPTNTFRQFDYGPVGNLGRYGAMVPPDYDIRRVTCNLTLWWGDTDFLAVQSNVDVIHRKIPNATVVKVAAEEWNHFDFLINLDAKALVFDGIIARLQDYDRRNPSAVRARPAAGPAKSSLGDFIRDNVKKIARAAS